GELETGVVTGQVSSMSGITVMSSLPSSASQTTLSGTQQPTTPTPSKMTSNTAPYGESLESQSTTHLPDSSITDTGLKTDIVTALGSLKTQATDVSLDKIESTATIIKEKYMTTLSPMGVTLGRGFGRKSSTSKDNGELETGVVAGQVSSMSGITVMSSLPSSATQTTLSGTQQPTTPTPSKMTSNTAPYGESLESQSTTHLPDSSITDTGLKTDIVTALGSLKTQATDVSLGRIEWTATIIKDKYMTTKSPMGVALGRGFGRKSSTSKDNGQLETGVVTGQVSSMSGITVMSSLPSSASQITLSGTQQPTTPTPS